MLHLLDETLEAFLRAEVPLPARQIDVSFSAPDSEWGAAVTKPTVNLFLWDVKRNTAFRTAGINERYLKMEIEGLRKRCESGHASYSAPPPTAASSTPPTSS